MSEVTSLITTIAGLSELYVSVHVLNLVQDSVYTVKSNPHIDRLIAGQTTLQNKIHNVMKNITADSSVDVILKFTDLSTLEDRMYGNRFISVLFNGYDHGWCKAYFIRMDRSSKLHSVIFAVEDLADDDCRSVEELLRLREENKQLRQQLESLKNNSD